MMKKRSFKMVLTGGPGSGKTAVAETLAQRFQGRLVLVPEAATQVYQRLGTRWDLLDDAGRRAVQREIYRLQVDQEDRLATEHPGSLLLLDRGTVDGAAYWPGGAHEYWGELKTDHRTELARYDAVLWLECGAAVGCYDGVGSNACRSEDAETALEYGRRVRELWSDHRAMAVVNACVQFEEKVARIEAAVRKCLETQADRPGSQ